MSGETHCTKKDEGQAAIGFFVFGFSFFVNVQWLHTGPNDALPYHRRRNDTLACPGRTRPYPGYGRGVLDSPQRLLQ
jgi:hypothetical protein